jgi:hypothetical protein
MAPVVIDPAVPDRTSLDNEIARLRGLEVGALRARWHTVFRRRAPLAYPATCCFVFWPIGSKPIGLANWMPTVGVDRDVGDVGDPELVPVVGTIFLARFGKIGRSWLLSVVAMRGRTVKPILLHQPHDLLVPRAAHRYGANPCSISSIYESLTAVASRAMGRLTTTKVWLTRSARIDNVVESECNSPARTRLGPPSSFDSCDRGLPRPRKTSAQREARQVHRAVRPCD